MDEKLLLNKIKNPLSKRDVLDLANWCLAENFSIPLLIDLTFQSDKKMRFKSAWILEKVFLINPIQFKPYITYFWERFSEQDYPSAQRHFTRILLELTKNTEIDPPSAIIVKFAEGLIETIFSWLINDDSPVAVKAHCLSILANFSSSHWWIREELLQTINHLEGRERSAFYVRAKRVREKLKSGSLGSSWVFWLMIQLENLRHSGFPLSTFNFPLSTFNLQL